MEESDLIVKFIGRLFNLQRVSNYMGLLGLFLPFLTKFVETADDDVSDENINLANNIRKSTCTIIQFYLNWRLFTWNKEKHQLSEMKTIVKLICLVHYGMDKLIKDFLIFYFYGKEQNNMDTAFIVINILVTFGVILENRELQALYLVIFNFTFTLVQIGSMVSTASDLNFELDDRIIYMHVYFVFQYGYCFISGTGHVLLLNILLKKINVT